MVTVAKIAVDNAAYGFDKLYTYLLPEPLDVQVTSGCRVKVPFGGGNRSRTGIVLAVEPVEEANKLKPVLACLDEQPLLDEEGLMLLRYLKAHTFCTWFDALHLIIPAGLNIVHKTVYTVGHPPEEGELTVRQAEIVTWLRTQRKGVDEQKLCGYFGITRKDPELTALLEKGLVLHREQSGQKLRDDKISMVRLSPNYRPERLTEKQKRVAAFLEENEAVSLKEICYYTGVTRVVVENMHKHGQVELYNAVRYRSPFVEDAFPGECVPKLSEAQQAAYDELFAMLKEPAPAPALLYGVTGAGKTAVFQQLTAAVAEQGRQVLVLVPEISLTAQAVEGYRRRFGEEVAVLHSGLSAGERVDEWRRIREGKASIVVGTRSAVFAPLDKIGLIVIDEEQEHTYCSDKSPRFHAREVALWRCRWHGALLLLASATPSVESYYHAQQGKYRLVKLEQRYGTAQLPDVYTVDMQDSANHTPYSNLSQPLLEELQYNLEHGEQSILLLNRRGYSTLVKCTSCGTAADCPNCSVAMTYHAANDRLICHYCGYTREKPTSCEHCGSELIRYAGTGTQKLEEVLASLFPQARILRVDMDTTMTKFAHERLFSAFAAHDYDIMVGTQMVAKGLNFPDVTLVGVINADQSLYAGDFRSYERSFSLLTQVVGRSGRGTRRGRAYVQTYSPENPVIQLAARQDYPGFYVQEIASRKMHLYPPFCTMAGVGFTGESLDEVRRWSDAFLERFRTVAAEQYSTLPVRVLGPVPAEVLRAAGKYRFKLSVKCRNSPAMRELFASMLEWFYGQCKTVSVFVDMHYDRL